MTRTFLATLALVLIVAGTALEAQVHRSGYFAVTQRDKFFSFGLRVDPRGNVTTMQLGYEHHNVCEVAADNRSILVCDPAAQAIWQIDPSAMAVVGTLISDPALGTAVYGMEYDHNGDLYVLTGSSLLRIGAATVTTVTTANLSFANATIDIDTAELLVAVGLNAGMLQRIDRQTGAATTLATGFSTRYGDAAQDPRTGDVYVPTCCGVNSSPLRSLDVRRAGTTVSTIYLASNALAGAYGVQFDRASASTPRIVTGCVRNLLAPASGGVWFIDVATAVPQQLAPFPSATVTDVSFLEGRNLHTTRTAAGRYRVDISVPTDAGLNYVLGVGYTGVRPGVALPDGRRILLNPDGLTMLATANGLAPFVTNTVGSLDAAGRATAMIDVSGLVPAIRGMLVWLSVVTLDPRSPLGIATISDPFVLKMD